MWVPLSVSVTNETSPCAKFASHVKLDGRVNTAKAPTRWCTATTFRPNARSCPRKLVKEGETEKYKIPSDVLGYGHQRLFIFGCISAIQVPIFSQPVSISGPCSVWDSEWFIQNLRVVTSESKRPRPNILALQLANVFCDSLILEKRDKSRRSVTCLYRVMI